MRMTFRRCSIALTGMLLLYGGSRSSVAGSPLLDQARALHTAKKYPEAEEAFTRAIAENPDDASLYSGRAGARIMQKDYAGAGRDYDEMVRRYPQDAGHRSSRANFRSSFLKDYPGAIKDLTKALELSPKSLNYHVSRARALLNAGYAKEALADLDLYLASNQGKAWDHLLRGDIFVALGRPDDAKKSYESALASTPNYGPAVKAMEKLAAGAGKTAVKPPPVPASSLMAPTPEEKGPTEEQALRRRTFRLVKVSGPETYGKNDWGSLRPEFLGKGRKAGFKCSWTASTGEPGGNELSWEVPAEIVPGKPARFSMEGAASGVGQTYGYITLYTPEGESIIAGVRVTRNKHVGPDFPRDSFDLVLPDIATAPEETLAGRGDRETVLRLRPKKFEEEVIDGPWGNQKTPADFPLEERRIPLHRWTRGDSRARTLDGLRVRVDYDSSRFPIAAYEYRAAETVLLGVEVKPGEDGATSVLPDGRDGIFLRARATPRPDGTPRGPEATKSILFSAEGPGADWADLSEAEVRDGWQTVFVKASNPDAARGTYQPPEFLTISAQGSDTDGTAIGGSFRVALTPRPVLDVDRDRVEFSAKSGEKAELKVWVDGAGAAPWRFRTEYADKGRPVAKASLRPTGASSADLTLTEAGLEPEPGSANEAVVLKVFAERDGTDPLERHIKIIMGQEGVFVSPVGRDPSEGLYRLAADGSGKPTDVDFRIFVMDEAKKALVNGPELAEKLLITSLEPEGGVASRVMRLGGLKWAYAGTRASNDPSGILRFTMPKEIPGDGRIIRADFKAELPGRSEEGFTAIFTLGFVTTSDGPGSADWALEAKRCEDVIQKFVPPAYHAQLLEMLNRRKQTLGADGLRTLRERLWRTAVELTLGEGGQGYASEAAWAGGITSALEWAEWAGDMAFGAVIGSWTGPYGATGAGMLKTAVISAARAYQEGRSAEEWLWENLSTIPGLLEGKVVDPDAFEKWGVGSKAKAWAVYIGYNFLKNLYNGATVTEALKNTAKEAGSGVLSNWLSDKAAASRAPAAAETAPRAPDGAETPAVRAPDAEAGAQPKTAGGGDAPPPVKTSPAESDAAARIQKKVAERDGKRFADPEDVLALMRDPSQVRALKKAPPAVQEAFSNTREAIYRQHDESVVSYLKESVPDLKYRMVKVFEFRTPGQSGPSLNTDRDYRVCYYAGRDPNTGKERWVEVDRRKWEAHSYQTFARLTGGPADDPGAAREWAAEHQQLATDKSHTEASADFTDQATIWNPKSGRYEKTTIVSQVVRVKEGQQGASLNDPAGLALMYRTKVADARFKHEALVQAKKAVAELEALRKGYETQGRGVGELPKPVQEAMSAVVEANKRLEADPNRRDPKAVAEAEKSLRAAGFRDLGDFMDKLGGQFESLKFAPRP